MIVLVYYGRITLCMKFCIYYPWNKTTFHSMKQNKLKVYKSLKVLLKRSSPASGFVVSESDGKLRDNFSSLIHLHY